MPEAPIANGNPAVNRDLIELVIFFCTSTPSLPCSSFLLLVRWDADFPITSQDGQAIVPAYCASHRPFTDTNSCLGGGVFCLFVWCSGGWSFFLACAIETLRWGISDVIYSHRLGEWYRWSFHFQENSHVSIARKVWSLWNYLIIFHCIWSGLLIAAVPLLVEMVVVLPAGWEIEGDPHFRWK